MEWCSHCCRFCPTRVESTMDEFSGQYFSSCTMCGKVLLDLSNPLDVIFPIKRIKKVAGRAKTRRKSTVNVAKRSSDTTSKDSLEENNQ